VPKRTLYSIKRVASWIRTVELTSSSVVALMWGGQLLPEAWFRTETGLMKAYLITTGTVFGLITLAHIWRVIVEGPHLATNPVFVLLTFAAAALCVWAWRLLKCSSRRDN
jgi:hypothetical protein